MLPVSITTIAEECLLCNYGFDECMYLRVHRVIMASMNICIGNVYVFSLWIVAFILETISICISTPRFINVLKQKLKNYKIVEKRYIFPFTVRNKIKL